ncbi:MAG: isoamylase early set domain-containing protein [Verrucomicrobia bacterium]|nr:isoamylase early set domain-containing protein [Verrucomicrobiota bacterium]MCF7709419.1 isoamylase early set domain-containing protein [Verrucomicrobiota bacterium]
MLDKSFTAGITAKNRYSAKKQLRPTRFICDAKDAERVSIIGDFNHWDPKMHQMERQPDGAWFIQIPLHHGHHRYLFLVDGKPQLDPLAQGIARNDKNERLSLIAVS